MQAHQWGRGCSDSVSWFLRGENKQELYRRATFHSLNSLWYSSFMGLWIAANTSAAARSDSHMGLTSRPAINSKDLSQRLSVETGAVGSGCQAASLGLSFKLVLSGNRRLVASSSSWRPPNDCSRILMDERSRRSMRGESVMKRRQQVTGGPTREAGM